jgi:DNA invertase Pin-like site-specific DNA recombinase
MTAWCSIGQYSYVVVFNRNGWSPSPVDSTTYIGDLQDLVSTVKGRGASLKATEQPIDTSTAAGECFLDMLGVLVRDEPTPGTSA